MDKNDYITNPSERKKGKHLAAEDRGAIHALRKEGYGVRAIIRNIGCASGTITYELRRGTPERKGARGRSPGYSAKHGEKVYKSNRSRLGGRQFREHKWSPDSSYCYAKRMHIRVDFQHPKLHLENASVRLTGIYAHIFQVEAEGKRYTLPYVDVLLHRVELLD